MFYLSKKIDIDDVLANTDQLLKEVENQLKVWAEDKLETVADKTFKIDFSQVDFQKMEDKLLAEFGPELLAEIINRGPFHRIER